MKNRSNHYQEDLAYVHDTGYGHVARNAANTLLEQLKKQQILKGLIIDLGCGSGIMAKTLTEQAYEVLGIDYSTALIEIARKQAPKAQFKVGSFLEVDFPSCQAVTAIGEVFNYLFDERNTDQLLIQVFQKVFAALTPGGIFLFDLIEPGLQGGISNVKRLIEQEEWTMFLDYTEDEKLQTLERKITLFRKIGETYRKSKELHCLRLYHRNVIKKMLEDVGFSVSLIEQYGELPLRNKNVGFVAIKPG